MKKLCAVLLCALLLLPIFAGCAASGDLASLPPLSDEKKEQIRKDYLAYRTLSEDHVTDEEFWKNSWLQYYGSYNGYDVFLDPNNGMGSLAVITEIQIAGQKFTYGHPFSLLAYKDGEFQDLKAVYEAGGITKQQIKQIAAYYRNAYPHFYEQ